MKICRYNNKRLGIVIGDNVHDVHRRADQHQAAAAPYTAKADG